MNVRVPEAGFSKRAMPLSLTRPLPIVIWAWAGAATLAFQIYVLAAWVFGSHFVATPPGADAVTDTQHFYYLSLQVGVTGAAVFCLFKWLVLPWIHEGRMTADGRLFAAGAMIFFWDMGMNYTSTSLFYNSHLVNFGAWSLGSWPGWMSPNGNLLPEPIFITLPGYTSLVTTQAIFICWLLRKAKTRWPTMGLLGMLGFIVLGCTVVDTLIEITLLRTGIYAYPGAVRSLSLFAGQIYQFPLYEGLLFGGFGVGAMTALHFFRDDKGQTLAERGVDELKMGATGRQWMRGLAVYGFCHLCFFVLYTVPMQWFSLHSDPYPAGYPSYMTNGMCVYGINADQCPGPGVMMPRL
ncbi:spirocyclase AveC family protein [Hydrocarboniphaga sp.]|uniref:spirocyclase AveC family protein n=1 Tax=Hydrocarboniphaga sp. TaxID=2033016 RepID=UPI003D0CDF5F